MRARFRLITVAVTIGLFLGMVVLLETGRRLGLRDLAAHGQAPSVSVVEGAVYGLLALLLGFSFSGAAGRFDRRRETVAEEVNAIGTAWQRLDLLPAEPREQLRTDVRQYLDALLESYASADTPNKALVKPEALARAQSEIWTCAVMACLAPTGEGARVLLLPALNDMFGMVERERLARRIHAPLMIFGMLGVTALVAALFGGYSMASASARAWMHTLGVAATTAVAIYVILDLEYPRLGLIRVKALDRALAELRVTMR